MESFDNYNYNVSKLFYTVRKRMRLTFMNGTPVIFINERFLPSFLFPGFLPGTFPENIGIFPYTVINIIRGIVQSVVLKFISINVTQSVFVVYLVWHSK